MDQPQFQNQPTNNRNPLALPIAIVIGFALIAGAIYFGSTPANAPANQVANEQSPESAAPEGPVKPINEDDHYRGNPNAPIVIIEYSDYECPYCRDFHSSMKQIVDSYGATGDVVWVFRHMPIEVQHPSAKRIAMASECVAELAGNDAFWTFSDIIFEERESDFTNMTQLTNYAERAGADPIAFDNCLESERTAPLVEADMQSAVEAGVKGTPYSYVLVGNEVGYINGAKSYSVISSIIETIQGQAETATN